MTVTVTINSSALQKKFKEKLSASQKWLDNAVLTDSNIYCPMLNGALKASGITNTIIGSGKVSWVTDYARVQYYNNFNHSKGRNPYATMKWFETAKAKNKTKWLEGAKKQWS